MGCRHNGTAPACMQMPRSHLRAENCRRCAESCQYASNCIHDQVYMNPRTLVVRPAGLSLSCQLQLSSCVPLRCALGMSGACPTLCAACHLLYAGGAHAWRRTSRRSVVNEAHPGACSEPGPTRDIPGGMCMLSTIPSSQSMCVWHRDRCPLVHSVHACVFVRTQRLRVRSQPILEHICAGGGCAGP